MSRGTLLVFNKFKERMGDGTHDLDDNTFLAAIISEQAGGAPTIAVDDANPALGTYTEVVGGTYAAAALTLSWIESGGVVTFAVTSGSSVWATDASGALDMKTVLIYDNTDAGKGAVAFVDLTIDGTTAVSTQNGAVTVNWQPDIFTLT